MKKTTLIFCLFSFFHMSVTPLYANKGGDEYKEKYPWPKEREHSKVFQTYTASTDIELVMERAWCWSSVLRHPKLVAMLAAGNHVGKVDIITVSHYYRKEMYPADAFWLEDRDDLEIFYVSSEGTPLGSTRFHGCWSLRN